jgi:pilus assembly protein CpaB
MKLSIPQKLRPGRTWVVLGAALGIGVLAAAIAYGYLARQIAAIEARAKGETVEVLVAKRELDTGAKLSANTIAIRKVPRDFAHSAALKPSDFEKVNGQALAYPIKGGEMVMWGLLEAKRTPTFSARVGTGRRAMTVPVDEINSISGMLEPGDMIDLMVTMDRKSKKHTFPLLQSVQVMATGQRSADDPKSGERRSYTTVTLDATPEQAHNLIVAREAGKITALLRNPQDKQLMKTSPADIAALLGMESQQGGRQIPVLYGGSVSRLTEDMTSLLRPALSAATAKSTAPIAATDASATTAGSENRAAASTATR